MNRFLTRRTTLIGAAALLPALSVRRACATSTGSLAVPNERIAAIEARHGGRLGVAALDTGSGRHLEHRADERFALCSTFKFLAAAAVLERVDRDVEWLDRRITYGEGDILEYAPVAKKHVKDGMTLAELCAAAVEWSDNTAANLLLQAIGGPEGLTRYARSLGDQVTRLDRTEPELNVVAPSDERDTTSPAAMLVLMNAILCGKALSDRSRQQLDAWLVAAKPGKNRLPAGLPLGWRIGHKTGTGAAAETNDIAIIWRRGHAPILVAAYYTESAEPMAAREAALAEVGQVVADVF
jgi:beta-lactamase class A